MSSVGLPIFSEQAASTSSKLVKCSGCTKCCENGGPVYVRENEVEKLRELEVPIVTIQGVSFIERLAGGVCPMLDQANKKCNIYDHRPLCCRLFPLDIFKISSELRWALYVDCPRDRQNFERSQGLGSLIGIGSVGKIASSLEAVFSNEDLEFFEKKEEVSERIGILEENQENQWKIVSGRISNLSERPEWRHG